MAAAIIGIGMRRSLARLTASRQALTLRVLPDDGRNDHDAISRGDSEGL